MSVTGVSTYRPTAGRVAILGGLSACAPMSVDMYLPSMPQIAADLHTGASQVQLTLTTSILGLAFGQLVLGSLSDAFGRRRPLLAGLAVYTVLSLVCLIAPNATVLIALRFAQGFAGAAGPVLARAIVRDLTSGAAMARLVSMLMLVTSLAPILAPALGAQLLAFGSWRGVFVALAVFGAVLLVACALWLPETLPSEARHTGGLSTSLRAYRTLLADRTFLGYALTSGLVFAGYFGYLSGSAFVLEQGHGLSTQEFSVVFGANAIGLLAAGQSNAWLVRRYPPRRMLIIGVVAGAVAVVALTAAALAGLGLPALLPPMFVAVAAMGLVAPNCTALGMADHPSIAGSASALLGVLQFVAGGIAGPLVGLGSAGGASDLSMALVMLVGGVGALLFIPRRGSRSTPRK
ncbi:multidrug effflux MFS transporter [Amycolatopsis sp. CA-230715]|uniref:multidrug effflux MFS transporter n=1 Tax=Amycolatopsis sp. CA-230715 TaxID=2745196 RepID=UPI001C036F5B|nr:multidrug effflux MFS transporter [Amycolatopsis sp. CA-230715]QWF81223.1 Bicyclomycin resistance protein [Amycolatopsis sp. CA-230715]